MAEISMLKKFRKDQFEKTRNNLNYANEITSFIHTYGPLCDSNYFSLILNFNNVVERYLRNGDSKTILNIYDVYANGILENKSENEIFKLIRQEIYKLPSYMITDTPQRMIRYR